VTAALSGKVVVLIGGTTGIGLAAAHGCLGAGAQLVCVGRDDETSHAAQRALGDHTRVIAADACAPDTAVRAIEEAVRAFGRFDALYHVAGGSGRKFGDGPLHELTDEGWTKTLELNLTSVMLSNRAAVRQFLAQRTPGSILNLASVLAARPSPRHFSTHAYATAKAGIIGLSQSIAASYAANDIRVNVLAPGLVDTPMAQRAAQDEAIQSFIRTKQPLDGGRIGHPDDLAAAAVFFLSEQSRFCTGQVLAIDGGWSVSEGQFAE
jgi:NAD(P)-dependent dehydrogenase (short-subunit alcohol dehydrogenase family)